MHHTQGLHPLFFYGKPWRLDRHTCCRSKTRLLDVEIRCFKLKQYCISLSKAQPVIRTFIYRTRFLIYGYLMLTLHAQAQDTIPIKYAGISYLSEGGLYPGIAVNFEKTLLHNSRLQMLLGGKAGGYVHYKNHTGIFVLLQAGQRYRIHKKLYIEHFLGLGYLHSFLNGGDAYYVNASGQLQKAHNTGNPHFMPTISGGLSYAMTFSGRPVMISGRPMIFWQIPFNQASLIQYAVEVGVMVKLKK
jgi:hypothetical protein